MNIIFLCLMICSNMLYVNPLNIKQVENIPSKNSFEKYEDLTKNILNETNQYNNSTESSGIFKNNFNKNFEHIYKFVDELISLQNDKQLERNLKLVKDQKLFKEAYDKIQIEMTQYVKNEDKNIKLPQGLASYLNEQLYGIENAIKKVEPSEDKFFKEMLKKFKGLTVPTNNSHNHKHEEDVDLLSYKKNGNELDFYQGSLSFKNSTKNENYNDKKLNPSEVMKLDKKLSKLQEVSKKLENLIYLILEALLKDISYGYPSTFSSDHYSFNINGQNNTTQQLNTAQKNNTSQQNPPPKPGLILI